MVACLRIRPFRHQHIASHKQGCQYNEAGSDGTEGENPAAPVLPEITSHTSNAFQSHHKASVRRHCRAVFFYPLIQGIGIFISCKG